MWSLARKREEADFGGLGLGSRKKLYKNFRLLENVSFLCKKSSKCEIFPKYNKLFKITNYKKYASILEALLLLAIYL